MKIKIPRECILNAIIKNHRTQFIYAENKYAVLYIKMEKELEDYLNNNGIRVRCEYSSISRVDIEDPENIERKYAALDPEVIYSYTMDIERCKAPQFISRGREFEEYLNNLYVESDNSEVLSYLKMAL